MARRSVNPQTLLRRRLWGVSDFYEDKTMEIRTLKLPCNAVLLDTIAQTGNYGSYDPADAAWMQAAVILDMDAMRACDPERYDDVALILCADWPVENLDDYGLVWLEG